jgi:hypothetical protein
MDIEKLISGKAYDIDIEKLISGEGGGVGFGATDGSNSNDGANVWSSEVGSAVRSFVVGSEVREG